VLTIGFLSISLEYGLKCDSGIGMKKIFFQLCMQITGIQITLSTWVRPNKVVRVLALEVQRLLSVYKLHPRLALSNEIRVYGTNF